MFTSQALRGGSDDLFQRKLSRACFTRVCMQMFMPGAIVFAKFAHFSVCASKNI